MEKAYPNVKNRRKELHRLYSAEKVESVYDPVLYSLLVIGINLFGNLEKWKVLRLILSIAFHITSLAASFTICCLLGFFLDGFKHDVLSSLLLICSGMIFRLIFFRKRKDFVILLKILSKCKIKLQRKSTVKNIRRAHLFLCASIVSVTVSAFCILITSSFSEKYKQFISQSPKWYTILNRIHPNVPDVFVITFVYSLFFCCSLPLCLSVIFHGLISWHLNVILDFTKKTIVNSPYAFKSNHSLYCRARQLVNLADAHFKYPSSLCILSVSIILYFVLFGRIQEHVEVQEYRVSSIVTLFLIFISVATSVRQSGNISVINRQILAVVNEIPLREGLLCQRLCLIQQIQQDLCLTVGGAIPITQNFPLVLFGTILTYSLLIRTFF